MNTESNSEKLFCLICAFAGVSKRASTKKKVFLPYDQAFLACLCPSHEGATPDEIRAAFFGLASEGNH